MSLYSHYSNYSGPWLWASFTPKEISCRHCGEIFLDPKSMDALQRLRVNWGRPIVLTSAHRCVTHNKNVGGAKNSQHLNVAFDCACPAENQDDFVKAALDVGFRGVGKYPSRGFVHLDMGEKRTWIGK